MLNQRVPLILQASIEDERFSVAFDGLQKVIGPFGISNFHYIPVVFHEAEKASKDHRTLLELLGLILGTVQGAEPGWGILMNGENGAPTRFLLRPDRRDARRVLQGLTEIQAQEAIPRLVLNRHCHGCEFRDHCQAQAIAKDDLSLLRSIQSWLPLLHELQSPKSRATSFIPKEGLHL